MAALLDLSPDTAHPVLSGAAEIEQVLDRILAGASIPFGAGDCAAAVQALERIGRRVDAVKLKLLAAADKTGTAADAGFTGTDAWAAKNTTVPRATAARQVALATELETGAHHATAAALDQGLVCPGHAAVILNAGQQLPHTLSKEQRRVVEDWSSRPNASTPTSCAGSPAAPSRRSNPTRTPSTPMRTSRSSGASRSPPVHPRHRLQPRVPSRWQRPIQQTDVSKRPGKAARLSEHFLRPCRGWRWDPPWSSSGWRVGSPRRPKPNIPRFAPPVHL